VAVVYSTISELSCKHHVESACNKPNTLKVL